MIAFKMMMIRLGQFMGVFRGIWTISSVNTPNVTYAGKQPIVDRCGNGVMWAVTSYQNTGSTPVSVATFYSSDNGDTWNSGSLINNSLNSNTTARDSKPVLFIDVDDYAHLVYIDNNDANVYYRRGTPNTTRTEFTWSSPTKVVNETAVTDYDIVAHKEGSGWVCHLVYSHGTFTTTHYIKIAIDVSGTITLSAALSIASNSNSTITMSPSIDFHHIGDGKTVANGLPHIYIAWCINYSGAKYIQFLKRTYSNGAWSSGSARTISSTRTVSSPPSNWLSCRYDGTRIVIGGKFSSGSDLVLALYDYPENDPGITPTPTDLLTSSSTLNNGSMTYDQVGNIYLVGLYGATSAQSIVYYKWTRLSNTLTGPFTIDSVNISYGSNVSVKRGYSKNAIDFIYIRAAGSAPYQIMYGGFV